MAKKICGIYGIQNKLTGKWYVGQSQHIEKRFATHRKNLAMGTHQNQHLQKAFDKYGQENFEFQILEVCDVKLLNDLEVEWIKKKDSKENGYNLTLGGDGVRGYKFSDEVKAIISRNLTGRPVLKRQREKMHIANVGANNPMYGRKHTEETKKKMSEAHKGEKCYLYRKHRTEEVREAISKAKKGKPAVNRKAVLCVETGEVFSSIKQAANFINRKRSTLSIACKNGKTCGGYHWEYRKVVA